MHTTPELHPSAVTNPPVKTTGAELFSQLPPESIQQLQWFSRLLESEVRIPFLDADDHQQELSLDLLRKLPRLDLARAGLRTFAAQIMQSAASNVKRHHYAQRRRCRPKSLDIPVATVGDAELTLGDFVSGDCRRPRMNLEHQSDLEMDSQECLEQLTPLQQTLCTMMTDSSERQMAQTLGISRHSIRTEIQNIRRCFVRNDMAAYL